MINCSIGLLFQQNTDSKTFECAWGHVGRKRATGIRLQLAHSRRGRRREEGGWAAEARHSPPRDPHHAAQITARCFGAIFTQSRVKLIVGVGPLGVLHPDRHHSRLPRPGRSTPGRAMQR
jgi:hypothetical protein